MITKGLMSCDSVEWETPEALFEKLDEMFHFNLDPCSTDKNAKCERHFTREDDGQRRGRRPHPDRYRKARNRVRCPVLQMQGADRRIRDG